MLNQLPILLLGLLLQAEVAEAPGPRSEFFVLREARVAGEAASTTTRPVAAARFVDRRKADGRLQLEWDVRFREGPRTSLVETHGVGRREMVWREFGAYSPTWLVELRGAAGGPNSVIETRWGLGDEVHRSAKSILPLRLPLELLWQARQGGLTGGLSGGVPGEVPGELSGASRAVRVAAPLEAAFLERELLVLPVPELLQSLACWPGGDRLLVVRNAGDRADPGAWSFLLHGNSLVAFRLRADGPWWTRCSREEWQGIGSSAERIRALSGNERPE